MLWTASWDAVGKHKVFVSFGKMSVLLRVFQCCVKSLPAGRRMVGGRFLGKNECLVLWTASWNAVGKQKVSVSFGKMIVFVVFFSVV